MKRFDLNALKGIVEDDQRVYLESGNPVSYNDPEEGRRFVREYQSGRGVIQKAKKQRPLLTPRVRKRRRPGFSKAVLSFKTERLLSCFAVGKKLPLPFCD